MKKLVIFGVGLIGGSVALALKKQANPPLCVGVGRSKASLNQALALNIIDEATTNIATALSDADMVLIATPVAQTQNILQNIKPHLNSKTIITDAGSTKTEVLAIAKAILGKQAKQFIGGHPIAGAEKSGPTAAMDSLYMAKNVVLTPSPENKQADIQQVHQLWLDCGAKVIEMVAEKHDSIFASVSHLPHILAFALVENMVARDNADELFQFAASGFRDFTRIAGSNPEMWRDISFANRTALLNEITSYEQALTKLKQALAEKDSDGLQTIFKRASKARNDWAANKNAANKK